MPSFDEMIDSYLAGVSQLRDGVKGMTPDQAAMRPIAGKWSTVECVAHVADFEPVFAERMKRLIALDRPLLMAADENAFYKHLAYDNRNLDEELALIESTRQQMARVLRGVPESVLERPGIHSYSGLMTLAEVLTYVTNHLTHHLRHILEKRSALGL